MTQKSFNTALKKGAIGESIVKKMLEGFGWCVFQPVTEGAHSFDMLCIKNKKQAFALDVKSKQRLKYYNATGVDQRHFDVYMSFSKKHNMPFYLAFIDELTGEVYGNTLAKLETEYFDGKYNYPLTIKNGQIRIWSIDSMNKLGNIEQEEKKMLLELNQRNAKYD
jgi:hypothetical protein